MRSLEGELLLLEKQTLTGTAGDGSRSEDGM
jgi:hypothetical protein